MRRILGWVFVLGGAGAFLNGCGSSSSATLDGGTPTGAAVGEPCTQTDDCRTGLVCDEDGTCQPPGNAVEGSTCELTGECADGLYCSPARTCEQAGTAAEGATCAATGDCERGLVCILEGFSALCRAAGTGDLGAACTGETDCLAGLSCQSAPDGQSASCTSLPPLMLPDGGLPPPSLPFWPGEDCETDEGPTRAYFQVPRGDDSDRDFYRLPYPNDIRRTDSGLDLSGHPTPGTVLPIDIIDRYLRASEEDLDGFATNPVAFFRFSKPYEWESIDGNFRLVDITPESPSYDQEQAVSWLTTLGPLTKYICEDWFAVATPAGFPLRPSTTYAVLLNTGLRPTAEAGTSFARDADFDAMLGDSEPTDDTLGRAWQQYAPLRAWLADTSTDASTLLNAAVFTTQTIDDSYPALRSVIRAAPPPEVSDLTVCDTDVTSPCDDETPQRACNASHPDYVEIHGRIRLPIFQQGTPPYETPEDGGGFEFDAAGEPTVSRSEDVCFALAVPRDTAPPAEGFPLMIYGHGTGGSFTGAIRNGLAADVANGDVDGTTVRAATLSIDFPQHGSRRGDSQREPDGLFFNFAHPRAARDNVAQGAADLLTLVHFATSYEADAASSPTGEAIRFDAARIALYVHSQSATHAALMVPHEPDLAAVVLSGNGGDLTESLLAKSQPVDIARVLPFALLDANAEGNLAGGSFHPALALFQAFFERVDPVNHARRLHLEPPAAAPGLHVFMTYGPGDTFSPEPTLQAYSFAARLALVRPLITADWRLTEVDAPLTPNVTVMGNPFAMGLRQYSPEDGEDGHFVAFRTDEGRRDTVGFTLRVLAGVAPEIGVP